MTEYTLNNRKMTLVLLIVSIISFKETNGWSTGRDLIFDKLGEYGFKQYFVTKYVKAQWINSRDVCQQFGMELARLEVASEADFIFRQVTYYGTGALTLNIDATTLTPGKTGWRWVGSNYPIDYTMRWAQGEPSGVLPQTCLSVLRTGTGVTAAFADVACSAAVITTTRVLCEIKHENVIHRYINSQGK